MHEPCTRVQSSRMACFLRSFSLQCVHRSLKQSYHVRRVHRSHRWSHRFKSCCDHHKPLQHKACKGFLMPEEDGHFHFRRAKMDGIHRPHRPAHIEKQRIFKRYFFIPVRRDVQNQMCSSSSITKCLPLEIHTSVWLK